MRKLCLAALALMLLADAAVADEPIVSISGYILTDFQYYVNSDGKYSDVSNGGNYEVKANSGFNTFEITRAYLTFNANLSEKISASLTTDLRTDSDGYRGIYAKFAYVEIKDLYPHSKLRFGLQSPPWNISDDDLWRYRMVEQGFYSYWGTFSTADFGVGLLGDVFDGKFKYHLAILNGEGYNHLETNRFKQYVGRLTLDLGSPDKFRFYPSVGYSSNHQDVNDLKDDVLMAGAGIDLSRFHVAGEYFQGVYGMQKGEYPLVRGVWPGGAIDAIVASDSAGILTKDTDVNWMGWAIYADVKVADKFNIFGRYDLYDPNTKPRYDKDGELFWTAGIAYHPISNLWISVDYREQSFQQPDPDGDGDKELPPIQIVYTHWKIAY